MYGRKIYYYVWQKDLGACGPRSQGNWWG